MRKLLRHTARRVTSTRSAILFWGGGYPSPVSAGGTPQKGHETSGSIMEMM